MEELVQYAAGTHQIVLLKVEIRRYAGGKRGAVCPHCPSRLRGRRSVNELYPTVIATSEHHILVPCQEIQVLLDIVPQECGVICPVFCVY